MKSTPASAVARSPMSLTDSTLTARKSSPIALAAASATALPVTSLASPGLYNMPKDRLRHRRRHRQHEVGLGGLELRQDLRDQRRIEVAVAIVVGDGLALDIA